MAEVGRATGGGGATPRGARRVWLARLAPGLPQLLERRWSSGPFVLAFWSGLLAVTVLRLPRIVEAVARGTTAERAAVAALVVAAVVLWGWCRRDLRREGEGTPAALRDLARSRTAVVGLWGVAALVLVALLAPLLAPHDPAAQLDLAALRLQEPGAGHPLGTDAFSRDVLSRLLHGARISLLIGVTAAAVSVGLGSVLGAVAGFFRGAADAVVMRAADVVLAFPRLVLLIAVVALFEPSLPLIIAVLGLTQWPQAARMVRGEVLSLRERTFVEAGRALGFSRLRLLAGHVAPNSAAPAIVAGALAVGDAIILEAGLSFLGLGVQPPAPSWGAMVADGRSHMLDAWWLATFPGLAVVVTVLAFNLAGDGFRDALDPRMER